MAFKDLGDWSSLAGLELPIGGKTYVVPPASAELGPRLQALVSAGVDIVQGKDPGSGDTEMLDDLGERDLFHEVLHPCEPDEIDCPPHEGDRCPRDVYAEMVADGVPWKAIKHAALTAIMDAAFDREAAEKYWASPGKPLGRKPADHKAPKGTASKTGKGSTAGTTGSRPAKKAASRGRGSSKTGT